MIILGIESSCDDTSVALVEAPSPPTGLRRASLFSKIKHSNDVNFKVLAEKTASQIEVHKKYGGVVPEIAGRKHAENILPVVEEVLNHKNIKTLKHKNIDAIAVTSGPGLITGLLVGVEAAKSLSYLWNIPLIGVNHIEGHIHSVQLSTNKDEADSIAPPMRGSSPPEGGVRGSIEFPAVCLIVSGGHTELILMHDHGKYELIGKTRDDAAGETFDKIGKLIGFDYPGGAKISKTAEDGDPNAIPFPRPMINEGYEFSFAGLKTSALYWLRDNAEQKEKIYNLKSKKLNDFCASFEQTIIDVLVTKTLRAVKEYQPKTVVLAGGVSANKKLRSTLEDALKAYNKDISYLLSPISHSMDNAAMIAVAGYYKAIKKQFDKWQDIEADPNWKIYS